MLYLRENYSFCSDGHDPCYPFLPTVTLLVFKTFIHSSFLLCSGDCFLCCEVNCFVFSCVDEDIDPLKQTNLSLS